MPMMPPCTKPFCCVRSSRKGRAISTAPELLAHLLLEGLDLRELCLDVGALLLQARLVRLEHREKALELRPLVAPGLVHVNQIADLGKRESQPFAAQSQLEARAVARRIDAALAVAPRREQPLVLVEADGARRDLELLRQLADGELGALLAAHR